MVRLALTQERTNATAATTVRTMLAPPMGLGPHFIKVGLNAKAVDSNEFSKYFYRYKIKYRFKVES